MSASPTKPRLTVGVLLESVDVPAWQFALLESIQKSDTANIDLLVVAEGTAQYAKSRLYRMFQEFEDKNRARGPDACATTSADKLLLNADRIAFDPTPVQGIDPAIIASISAKKLDVILVFVELESLRSIGSLARFGVWYFEAGGRPFSPASGAMSGFRELLHHRSHFTSTLQILLPDASEVCTAYQSFSAIDYVSHWITRNEHLWKCSTFAARALERCHALGGDAFLQSLRETSVRTGDQLQATSRTSVTLALWCAFLSYFLWRVRRKVYLRLFRERWVLMFGLDERIPGIGKFRTLVPPLGRFWADPHVVEVDGQHNVFFEDASQQTGIGHISVMADMGNGEFTSPRAILRRPYHLSYPFVFKWGETYFLIPESAENRTVELYRCIRFPDQWIFEHNLMEGISAYDATLVEHDGLWWLFANVREREGASSWDELCIYCAASPLSRNWRPHCQNPVVSDVRRARPAGGLFVEDGRLIRPSQDSSLRYGRALHFNEVIELNEHDYREVTVGTINPDWNNSVLAVHSYSLAGRLAFIDVIRRESKYRLIS